MSVTNESNKVNYSATGLTTYAIPFFFTDNTHVKLYVDDVLKTYLTDYTVTGANVELGGTLTLVMTPPVSGSVTVVREIPLKQENTFNEGGQMPAKTIERMFDKLTHLVQQISEKIGRSIKMPISSTTLDPQITGDVIPGALIQVNSGGTGLEMGISVSAYDSQLNAIKVLALAAQVAAELAETNAAASELAAAASETSVSGTAAAALASEVAALASEVAAAASAAAALISEGNASASEIAAAASEVSALAHKNAAAISAAAALASEVAAAASELAAASSETASGISETNAAASAAAASASEIAAAASALALSSVIVDSTAGSETTKAASVASMKTYVANNAGGSGGSLSWEKIGDLSPENESQDGIKLESFDYLNEQEIYLTLNVPENYQAGNPIKLKNGAFFTFATTNKVLFRALTALIRPGTTVLGTYSNTHTSTNSEVTAAGVANTLTAIGDIQLSDASGLINGVAVAANDKLRVKLSRKVASESASAASKAKLMINNFDVTFK